jgi:hypothetical protein
MPAMPKSILYLSTLLILATACARQPQAKSIEESAVKVPVNSFSFWENKIDRVGCSNEFDGSNQRFVRIFELSHDRQLLQIACDYGAYQDSYRSYLIDAFGNILKQLTFVIPIAEEPNKRQKSKTVWGNISLTDNNQLELLYLSAGSGECGYRVIYQIDTVSKEIDATPTSVYADSDCYNGILVPSWPKVEIE